MNKRNKIFKILIIVLVVFIMTGCESVKMNTSSCLKCGDAYFPIDLVKFCSGAINFIKIIVPTIIVIVGMIDLVRAVIASDDKQMEEAKKGLIRKFIAGIMIFLVIAIVQFAFNAIPNFEDGNVFECISSFINTPSVQAPCPKRINGKETSINGYKPKESQKEDDEEEISPIDCYDITDPNVCNEKGCWWENGVGCRPEDYGTLFSCYKNKNNGQTYWAPKDEHMSGAEWELLFTDARVGDRPRCENKSDKCYDCRGAAGINKYVWASSNPYPNGCYDTSYSKVDCEAKNTEGICWHCDIGQKYRWASSNPNNNYCRETALAKSECHD